MDKEINPIDPKLAMLDKLEDIDNKISVVAINMEELMFKIEHFKTRITQENVIQKDLLFSEDYKYDTTNSVVRSKLWWLYKEWDTLNLEDLTFLMDGFIYWDKKIFSVEDFYKILFLEVVIETRIAILKNKPIDYKLDDLVKEARKYAIANAWEKYYLENSDIELEEELEHPLLIEFKDTYFGRPVLEVRKFNRFDNINKVFIGENEWILTFSLGSGWQLAITKPNSYYTLK